MLDLFARGFTRQHLDRQPRIFQPLLCDSPHGLEMKAIFQSRIPVAVQLPLFRAVQQLGDAISLPAQQHALHDQTADAKVIQIHRVGEHAGLGYFGGALRHLLQERDRPGQQLFIGAFIIEIRRQHFDCQRRAILQPRSNGQSLAVGFVVGERKLQCVACQFQRGTISINADQFHRQQILHAFPQAQGIIHQARAGVATIIQRAQRARQSIFQRNIQRRHPASPFIGGGSLCHAAAVAIIRQMHPSLRGLAHIFLFGFGIFFAAGCQEYNTYQPLAEAESLSQITQLTEGFDRAGEATFSHDQRWIVFRGMKSPTPTLQLYLAKLNWREDRLIGIEHPIPVTPPGTRNFSGAFSSDGNSLIFSSTAQAVNPKPTTARFPIDMRIFRFDGWEGAISMTDASSGVDLARHPLTVDRAYTGECSYSPDGKWICFTSTLGGNPNLYVMHADGSRLVRLTRTVGYDGGASFSPDGKHLVYQSQRYTDNLTQIFTADLSFDHNGEITGISAEHQLTNEDSNNTNPAWHPDGIHIIYTTSRHGRDNYELYLMTNQGRRKTRITYSPGADLFPVFSPDGKYLTWASKRAKDGSIEVYAAQFHFPRGS